MSTTLGGPCFHGSTCWTTTQLGHIFWTSLKFGTSSPTDVTICQRCVQKMGEHMKFNLKLMRWLVATVSSDPLTFQTTHPLTLADHGGCGALSTWINLDGKEPKWCGLWNWHELTFPSWSPEANISNKETLMFWIHPIGFIHASLGWYDLIGGFNSQS